VSYVELADSRGYEFSYDAYGELTRVKLATGGSFRYAYGPGDPSGTPSGVICCDVQGGPTGLNNEITTYTSNGDALDRLTRVDFPDGVSAPPSAIYRRCNRSAASRAEHCSSSATRSKTLPLTPHAKQ